MSATGSVRGFMEFDDLCRGCQGYSDNLAQLFDTCDIEKGHRHKISFKQALKRLRNQVKESLHQIENDSFRKVTDFTIGKTFVKHRNGVTFNPMKKTTWSLGGGINGRWQSYKTEGYDGLVVIGCIERDLIPDDVMRFNKSLKMNQQIYTLGLEQALIQYYTLYKPDKRLRNKSFDIGNLSEGGYKGGIVYVAYKLEPEKGLSDDDDSELIKENVNSEETPRAFERLRLELLKIGLNFDHTPSLDIDSFFIACCTQLDRLGIPQRNYASLRQILVEQMKLFSLFITKEKLKFHNFTRENWNEYLDRLSNGKEENVCDLVIESVAKMLDKTIVIYSLSYPNGIDSASINDQANNGPSLLIAREKSNFISLAKVEDEKRTIKPADIKPALKQNKRPAETDSLDQGQTTITTPESTKIEKTDEVNIELHSVKRAKLQLDKLSEDVIESTAAAIKIPATRRQSATNQIDVLTAPSLSLNISTLTNQPIKPTSTETRSDQQRTTGLNVGETKNLTNQEKQRNKPIMKMTKEEKILILNSYINQRIKSDWDLLAETVFNERRQLKDPTINHYEKILTLRDLKGRIKKFVQGVRNGKRNNEEDPSVKALMEQIVEHKN